MIKNYFKIAWRSLGKSRMISFINITGLSIGMAAAILILLWVQNEFNYDNYHPDANRIYRITFSNKDKIQKWNGSPFLLAKAAKDEIPEIENATKFLLATWNNPVLNINNEFYKEKNAVFVDDAWFKLFHYDYAEGNASAFYQNLNNIILTESLAKKYYGNSSAVGQMIRIDTTLYQVQAVVNDNPSNSSFQFNIFFPLEKHLSDFEAAQNENSWHQFGWETFVVLNQTASAEKVTKKLNELFKEKSGDAAINAFLTSLKDIHFETGIGNGAIAHGDKKVALIFALLGILLLLIACINYVNLSTARASLRLKEISIKKIIGADRKALFQQFMVESFLTSTIAILFALLIIRLSLPFFNSFTEKHFTFSLTSMQLWEVLGGTLLFTILLNGIYPALLLSSLKPFAILRGMNVLKIKNTFLRKVFVVSQFTMAVALIIGTIVIFKQLNFIQQQSEGYNRSQIFSVSIPSAWFNNHKEINKEQHIKTFKQELLNTTGIENATITSGSVINIQMSMSGIVSWDGKDPDFNPSVSVISVDPDFREIFPLQIKEGRWFEPGNISDKHSYILNETALETFGIREPYIGQRFIFTGDTGQITGIVKDFHYQSYHEKIGPMVMVNAGWANSLFLKASVFQIPQSLKATEKIWKQFFPQQPFEYSFLDEAFDQLYRSDIKTSTLIGFFACITIIISCLGLFGLAAFIAEQRIKEIGIRKIMGASVQNIVTLLSTDFLKLIFIAAIIAFPVAWWAMNKWLQDFAYRIEISWWMFLAAGLLAIVIALITVSFQAIKAAIANPVKALRTE
jgi:putative ABC transport system permease protein